MAYKQARNRKKRLMKTYRKMPVRKYSAAGVWVDKDSGRYIKYSASNTPGYTKFLRRASNRKVRRATDIYRYGSYKKLYDCWWTLY